MLAQRFIGSLVAVICFAALLPAQKYSGPRPEKPDVLYLVHASKLVETEVAEAKEEKRKDDTIYVVDGVSSAAKTPMAEPIFLIESKRIVPDRLQLYKLETKSGKREILFSAKRRKDGPRSIHLSMKRVAEGLYRLEANENLSNGEYAVTPEGSNTVFLFQVY